MEGSIHHERGQLLLEQGRYEMAEASFRAQLAEDPNDGFAHLQLASALAAQEQGEEALESAKEGLSLLPDFPYAHYVLGCIYLNRKQIDEAKRAAEEALRLDAEDADYPGLLARIAIFKSSWEEALEFADLGLSLDPEHVECNNLRAHALQMLRRHDEAEVALETTLRRAPEDSTTHANQGWNHLRSGAYDESISHFKEALRTDPENEYARQGILEALRARTVLYRPILAYFVWMSRMTERGRWGFIIGIWLLFRFTRTALAEDDSLRPLLIGVSALYLIFVLTAWAGRAIFNVALWFHPLGRHALNRDEKAVSILCVSCLGLGLLSFLVGLLGISTVVSFYWAALFPFLCVPIAAAFDVSRPGKRRLGLVISSVFAAACLYGAASDLLSEATEPHGFFTLSLLGLVIFSWVGGAILRD